MNLVSEGLGCCGGAGVSKLWGENLGRMYADEHGLSVLCVRMGHCGDAPEDDRDVGARHHPACDRPPL